MSEAKGLKSWLTTTDHKRIGLGITAAVVGVILNLVVWFALHTLFGEVRELHAVGMRFLVPVFSSLNLPALLIAGAAFVAIFRLRWGMMATLGAAVAAGCAYYLLRQP